MTTPAHPDALRALWEKWIEERDALNAASKERDEIIRAAWRGQALGRQDCADELAAVLDRPAPPSEDGWQPIETAPEATYVLVYGPNQGVNIATMTRDPNIIGPNGCFWFVRGEDDRCHPTLWMPIPKLLAASRPAPEPAPQWQPIGGYDKAIHPSDVLVATSQGVGEARQHDDGAYGAWFWVNTCDDGAPGPGQIFPTHWMPLPAPPVAEAPHA